MALPLIPIAIGIAALALLRKGNGVSGSLPSQTPEEIAALKAEEKRKAEEAAKQKAIDDATKLLGTAGVLGAGIAKLFTGGAGGVTGTATGALVPTAGAGTGGAAGNGIALVTVVAVSQSIVGPLVILGIIAAFIIASLINKAMDAGREFKEHFWRMSAYADPATGGWAYRYLHDFEYQIAIAYLKSKNVNYSERQIEDLYYLTKASSASLKTTFGGRFTAVIPQGFSPPESEDFARTVRAMALTIMRERAYYAARAIRGFFPNNAQYVNDDFLIDSNLNRLAVMPLITGSGGGGKAVKPTNDYDVSRNAVCIAIGELMGLAKYDAEIFLGNEAEYTLSYFRRCNFHAEDTLADSSVSEEKARIRYMGNGIQFSNDVVGHGGVTYYPWRFRVKSDNQIVFNDGSGGVSI